MRLCPHKCAICEAQVKVSSYVSNAGIYVNGVPLRPMLPPYELDAWPAGTYQTYGDYLDETGRSSS